MADVLHLAGIKVEPNGVYEALTEQSHIREWWSQFAEASPEVGALNVVSFYGGMAEFKLRVSVPEWSRRSRSASSGKAPLLS